MLNEELDACIMEMIDKIRRQESLTVASLSYALGFAKAVKVMFPNNSYYASQLIDIALEKLFKILK